MLLDCLETTNHAKSQITYNPMTLRQTAGYHQMAAPISAVTTSRAFFKENVRYPVWTCRDLISLIPETRFSIPGTTLKNPATGMSILIAVRTKHKKS